MSCKVIGETRRIFDVRTIRVQILNSTPWEGMVVSQLFDLDEPQFSYLQNGDNAQWSPLLKEPER